MAEEGWGLSENTKDNLLKRLRRIEGQTRGVQRMIEEDRSCQEVMMQLAALKSAVVQVAMTMLSNQMGSCLKQELSKGGDPDTALAKFMEVFKKFS
jgi:DNA-binding FrmR family transcriptional regulator